MSASVPAVVWVVALVGVLTAVGTTAAATDDRPGMLQVAFYEASAFSHRDSGTFLWLTGPDGILRLEVRRGSGGGTLRETLDPLLAQRGQGWTAILAGSGDETLNAWGQEWRRPPPGAAAVVQLAGEALLAGPPAGSRSTGVWRAAGGVIPVRKHRIPSLREADLGRFRPPGFRSALTRRGAGRGGDDEMLTLRWRQAPAERLPVLEVSATRRPGRLELRHIGSRAVHYAYPEAFVPLWPLIDLVIFDP